MRPFPRWPTIASDPADLAATRPPGPRSDDDDDDERQPTKKWVAWWLLAAGVVLVLAGAAAVAAADRAHSARTCPTRSERWSDERPDRRVRGPARPLRQGLRDAVASPPMPRPNILVIVTDDQWKGTLSVMPQTRHWMFEEGTSFTHAYATTPLCCPSRSSILTGEYAHNHGVRNNDDGVQAIFDSEATVERYLHEAGYRTALFGKFLNGWPVDLSLPYFDRWAFIPRVSAGGFCDGVWNVNGTIRPVTQYSTAFIDRQAVAFLKATERRDDPRPWFLYVATPAPHLPATPEATYADATVPAFDPDPAELERDRSDKPTFVQIRSADLTSLETFRQRMLRSLMSVDDLVGSLFRTLKADDEARDTLVVFLSDNGFLFGEHGLSDKSLPYTNSIGVPMMLRWPAHVTAGERDPRIAANIDIAPTLLEAAGIRPDARYPLDGQSLLEPSGRTHLLTEFWRLDDYFVPSWASLLTRTFQYVEYFAEDGSITEREYYDLAVDPWQLVNLLGDADASNDPVHLHSLHARLARDRTCVGAPCP